LEDETLALNYLYLRDEYGAGKLLTNAEMRSSTPAMRDMHDGR
jgi:hypothetical protein